jgi:hypothetical protein
MRSGDALSKCDAASLQFASRYIPKPEITNRPPSTYNNQPA